MLKTLPPTKARRAGGSYAIIASRYNSRYVDSMLRAARKRLRDAGVDDLLVVRVPGAYEIPVVAARLARAHQPALSAILCLGVILRGETTHAQHIGEAVSQALALLQVQHEVPIIHEVLLLENEAQARARCLDPRHNRGAEAAETALAMGRLLRRLPGGLR